MLLIVGQTLKGNMKLDKMFVTGQLRFSSDSFLLPFLPFVVIFPHCSLWAPASVSLQNPRETRANMSRNLKFNRLQHSVWARKGSAAKCCNCCVFVPLPVRWQTQPRGKFCPVIWFWSKSALESRAALLKYYLDVLRKHAITATMWSQQSAMFLFSSFPVKFSSKFTAVSPSVSGSFSTSATKPYKGLLLGRKLWITLSFFMRLS